MRILRKQLPVLVTLQGIAVTVGLSGFPQIQNQTLIRQTPIALGKVPLDSSDPNALPNRDYDHATVAMNSNRNPAMA